MAWLIAGGAPLPHIQARLGHESITTTIDTYGHLLPAGDELISRIIDTALTGAASGRGHRRDCLQLRSGAVAWDRDDVRCHRLFAGGDEFVQMLDAEPDVLADPGAADLSLPDRISDPACGHVEIRRGFVDRQTTWRRGRWRSPPACWLD